MAPSLDPFPDLCLIAMFLHLPLSDLLAVVGLVCARWRGLLPTVLARRRSLKIVQTDLVVEPFEPDYPFGSELIYKIRRDDGSPWVVRTKVDTRNVVVVPNGALPQILTEPFPDGLMNSLPNITNLTVVFRRNFSQISLSELFTQITRMLNYWQDSLVTLNVSIRFDFGGRTEENTDPFVRNMLESIDRLRSLRHLKIDCKLPWVNFEPKFHIFSQLYTFAFRDWFAQDWIINSMKNYANPNVITQITVNSVVDLHKLLQFSPKLASKFTTANCSHTPIGLVDGSLDMIRTFCTRFISVQHLRIKLTGHLLHTISSNLAQLQHLVNLELTLRNPFLYGQRELTPLNSVRMLTVNMSTHNPNNSHQNIESCWLSQLFPNVQVFLMKHNSYVCRDCGYDSRLIYIERHPEVWPKIHECKRLARQTLTRFPKLHTIRLEQYPGTSDGTLTRCDIFDSLEQL